MPSIVKENMFSEIKNGLEKNPYVFISNFEGCTVQELSDMRRSLEKVSHRSLVVKHAVARKVFSELKLEGIEKLFDRQVLITFGDKDPQIISKALLTYVKTNKKVSASGVVFENKIYDSKFVQRLSELPSREELLTQVVVRIKSPISGFVMTLGQLLRGLVTVLNEVKKQKETGPAAA